MQNFYDNPLGQLGISEASERPSLQKYNIRKSIINNQKRESIGEIKQMLLAGNKKQIMHGSKDVLTMHSVEKDKKVKPVGELMFTKV